MAPSILYFHLKLARYTRFKSAVKAPHPRVVLVRCTAKRRTQFLLYISFSFQLCVCVCICTLLRLRSRRLETFLCVTIFQFLPSDPQFNLHLVLQIRSIQHRHIKIWNAFRPPKIIPYLLSIHFLIDYQLHQLKSHQDLRCAAPKNCAVVLGWSGCGV